MRSYTACLYAVFVCAVLCREYNAVVFYCHSSISVKTRFLYRAQDHNMTNGDFAFFTFEPFRSSHTDRLWQPLPADYDGVDYGYYEDEQDLPRRRRAYYAMKQVLVTSPGTGAKYCD